MLGINQRAYQTLKLSLSLNLRHQLLIAVCDNTILQDQLSTQLETEVAQLWLNTQRRGDQSPHNPTRLARLDFDPQQPDLVTQVAQWLKEQPRSTPQRIPSLQIVGIDKMTRQSSMMQHHFLQSLDKIEVLLPHLDASLLVWLPWPWFRSIQQSASRFWQWRSTVFEFVGDPTPIGSNESNGGLTSEPNRAAPPADGVLYGENRASTASATQGYLPGDLWNLISDDLNEIEQETTPAAPAALAQDVPPPPPKHALGAAVPSDEPATSATDLASAPPPPEAPRETAQPIGDAPQDETAQNRAAQSEVIQSHAAQDSAAQEDSAAQDNAAQHEVLQSETPSGISQQPFAEIEQREQSFVALEQLKDEQAPPAQIAEAFLGLGHFYREKIEAGDAHPDNIEAAIRAYGEAINWMLDVDETIGNVYNDLGTLYWMQAQMGNDRQQLLAGMQNSLDAYKAGIAQTDDKRQPDIASRLYSNVGAVHSTLAAYDQAVDNLKRSVQAYRQALPLCSIEQSADEYATLQNSLGSIYWKLSHYEQPKTFLHRAITAYNEALRCRQPERVPADYAAVQNNLGIAYWSLSKHERTVFLLKHAIAAYRDALNYRTPLADPAGCASTYNNLGTAYWELANKVDDTIDPADRYRKNAIIAYEAALKAAQIAAAQQPVALDLPAIHHCLGNIHDQLAMSAPQSAAITLHLGKAMRHYLTALKQQPKTAPTYEAMFNALVRNVRYHYDKLGINGQQQALNHLPANLLPEVMQNL
ncbi:MAG: tetratricopeptide repeat protein [Cyanobacteria bacterium P01_A01_bin.114]